MAIVILQEFLFAFLNGFFFIFHGALILFNLFGWVFRSTRLWNLFTLIATAISWFVLGIWKGWGYCPCTDWHFEIRHQMGLQIESNSYIDFLLRHFFELNFSKTLVDSATLGVFLLCMILSLWMNLMKGPLRERLKKNV